MKQPDIEIYIKQTNASEILEWLNNTFTSVSLIDLHEERFEQGLMIKGIVELDDRIPVVVTPKAAGKAYTSIWFQSDKTSWINDLDCAESFCAQFDREVRCSAETWTESEAENEEKWWCIKDGNKQLVRWG